MKTTIITLSLLISNLALANSRFECKSLRGDLANLTLQGRTIQWYDRTHSATSRGVYLGTEQAPYSAEKGFYTFDLIDFYRTNDSRFYVKIESNFMKKTTFKLVEGFDNDGHEEDEVRFACKPI